MPLLKSKYCTSSGVVFERLRRQEPRAFCAYRKELCKYYDKNGDQMCMVVDMKWKQEETNLYGLCSYVNRNKSSFIYAPQKTI